MTSLLVQDVRLVDANGETHGDLLVRDGVIAARGTGLRAPGVPVLAGEGRTLLPAFVDLHAHFRDPGQPEAEDIASGSQAAAKGGYTAVSVMPNTRPACDRPEVVRYVQEKAAQCAVVEVHPVGAITQDLAGEKLADLDGLAPHVWAFSDDGRGVERPDVALAAFRAAAALDRVIFPHCDYRQIADPRLSEELMAGRDLWLAERTGCRVHIAHVSSPGTLELVDWARSRGVKATCEVTPHHLCLDGDYRVNPPLCDAASRAALVTALQQGRVDAVATDHAPHSAEAKQAGAPGISSIEIAFALLFTRLVRERAISLSHLSRLMSLGPAQILGLRQGQLAVGMDGDVVLVEDAPFTVTAESLRSRGKNTPLLGETLRGRVWATVKRGRLIYLDGRFTQEGTDAH
jgi:dihydroorotase